MVVGDKDLFSLEFLGVYASDKYLFVRLVLSLERGCKFLKCVSVSLIIFQLLFSQTQLEMNNFVMAMLPEYFASPERYLPERWIKGASKQAIHPYIMIPFGHGPRMCVGKRCQVL